MPELTLEIQTDLSACERLWRSIVHPNGIQDTWEYRRVWASCYEGTPYFLCAKAQGEVVGFLPLEDFRAQHGYFWYYGGGHYVERSRVFSLPGSQDAVGQFLYSHLPPKTKMLYIDPGEIKFSSQLEPETTTYFLDVAAIKGNLENFFDRMSKKTRLSVKRDLRKIEELKPQIRVNAWNDLEALIAFNKARFGQASSFYEPDLELVIRKMVSDEGLNPFRRMLSFDIEGVLKGCTLNYFCNGVYTYYLAGNALDIPNMAKYIVYALFQDAIQLGATRIDVMADDCGWKQHWRMDPAQEYQFITK